MVYCNNQLKKYVTPLLRLVEGGALSNPLLMSMSEAFSVLFYALNEGTPHGSAGREFVCDVGDLGSIPGLGGFP